MNKIEHPIDCYIFGRHIVVREIEKDAFFICGMLIIIYWLW